MKEIGGYFEIEKFFGNEYYEKLHRFNYARNALEYLIKNKEITRLYVPFFLCQLVEEKCKELNVEVINYHINEKFLPELKIEESLTENEFIYIVNYYGFVNNSKIIDLKKIYNNIIVDNVQAFFQKPVDNVSTIYSCRKFFGVPDGAYLSDNSNSNCYDEVQSIKDDIYYMIGRLEENANQFYLDFRDVSNNIKSRNIKKMSLFTQNMLKAIDYEKVIKVREENFKFLNEAFKDVNKLSIENNIVGPYAYPLWLENASDIRRRMAENKIYIPLLWPNIQEENLTEIEKEYINNILPLPIDQRYTIEDMKYIKDVIEKEVLNYGL